MDDMINSKDIDFNFGYFETHDFHKLTKKKQRPKVFNVLYTIICSLQTNGKNLEIIISNLDYKFRVIAVSEA